LFVILYLSRRFCFQYLFTLIVFPAEVEAELSRLRHKNRKLDKRVKDLRNEKAILTHRHNPETSKRRHTFFEVSPPRTEASVRPETRRPAVNSNQDNLHREQATPVKTNILDSTSRNCNSSKNLYWDSSYRSQVCYREWLHSRLTAALIDNNLHPDFARTIRCLRLERLFDQMIKKSPPGDASVDRSVVVSIRRLNSPKKFPGFFNTTPFNIFDSIGKNFYSEAKPFLPKMLQNIFEDSLGNTPIETTAETHLTTEHMAGHAEVVDSVCACANDSYSLNETSSCRNLANVFEDRSDDRKIDQLSSERTAAACSIHAVEENPNDARSSFKESKTDQNATSQNIADKVKKALRRKRKSDSAPCKRDIAMSSSKISLGSFGKCDVKTKKRKQSQILKWFQGLFRRRTYSRNRLYW